MKRWKSLTAALCAAVLLCGFSAVPAFAYADGGEGENYGDPTMTEETTAPEPEPTIEPGEGFSEELIAESWQQFVPYFVWQLRRHATLPLMFLWKWAFQGKSKLQTSLPRQPCQYLHVLTS